MPVIGIAFQCEDGGAETRVNKEGHGEVTEDGDYYREENVNVKEYQHIRNKAEADPEAEIQRVEL